ncbi:hypothetical protein NON00_10825 [Roseomonas sp. GC11]|uniref:hypothetical protein n=1 Tax=Roseomonas sp. GC11 TaxID=2950546 RepID=UPI00210F11D8|nr:hypothetical protein [Roseomonas sp. GC11]MCQ4160422.1 hypothetical protein [Roseomonas sp. GC11]
MSLPVWQAKLVFSSENMKVLYRPGKTDYALVTFSHSNWTGERLDYWGRRLADNLDLTTVGIVARRNDWFCNPDMPAILAAARARLAGFRKVISFGSSMGGYAALKFSAAVGASSVLSFVPQYSIAPADVGAFDRRFLSHYEPARHDGMRIEEADVARNAYVFLDPNFRMDRRNVEMIRARAPRLQMVPARTTGHSTLELFAGTEKTARLFELALAEDHAGMLRFAAELSVNSPVRRRYLTKRLLQRRGPEVGLSYFRHWRADFGHGQGAVILAAIARAFLAQGREREALACATEGQALAPQNKGIQMVLDSLRQTTA